MRYRPFLASAFVTCLVVGAVGSMPAICAAAPGVAVTTYRVRSPRERPP